TAEFLTISAAVVPDREALVCGPSAEGRVTYSEMASRVNRLANALQALGVERGAAVAAMAVNSPQYVETYYACAKLGATFVPLNYRAKREELDYMVNASESQLLFVGERYLDLVGELRPKFGGVREYICYDPSTSLRAGSSAQDMHAYDELLAGAPDHELFVDIDENDASILIYTSGTTALPKGVVLTYLTLSVYVTNTMNPADPTAERDVTLLSVPIYHVAGATAIMSSIWGGRTLAMLPQFDPEAWLETVQRERVTHAFVVPTMLKRIMEHPRFRDYDLGSLKLITYGAAPMPYEVVRKAVDAFDCGLMNAYGQTESTSTLTYLGPDDHDIPKDDGPEREKKLRRLRSVGRVMEDITIAIMDESNEQLPPGEEGEICVAGPRVMREYYKQAEETAQAIIDGWLHTGDVGYLDGDGYLFITGRKKDMIIRGGENISSGEIEDVLEQHPAVEEAAVIGVPDPDWGEVVKAVVVLADGQRSTPDEIIAYCKERLASYKAPAYVALVDELPRNPLGKLLKTDLRKQHGEPANT
ncbi:MAG: long-chain-fatty-acid--CoA ligase, partial [Dehalococcoidia bacterium]|nr:long-chain-fatty-acid--CoA ligase [Dehalococcoidia bacterium]